MSLKDQMQQDLSIMFSLDDFARKIVYLTQTKEVTAIVDYLRYPEIEKDSHAESQANIWIQKSDLDNPVNPGDQFIFDSFTWTVINTDGTDDLVARILVRSKEGVVYDV